MNLVGRKRELARMEKGIGEGRAIIIEGESGIGKSALIENFCRNRRCHIGFCDEMIAYSPLNRILGRYTRIRRGYRGGKTVLIHEYGNNKIREIYENEKGKKIYLSKVDKNIEFKVYPKIMDYLKDGYAVFVENFNYIYYIDEELAKKIVRDGKKEKGRLIFNGNIRKIDGNTLHLFDEVSIFNARGNSRRCIFTNKREKGDVEISKERNMDLKRLYFEIYDVIKRNRGRRILIDFDDIIEFNGFENSYIWLKDIVDEVGDLIIYARGLRKEELGDISLIANMGEEMELEEIGESVVMEIAWSKYRLEDPEKEKIKIFDAVTEFINRRFRGKVIAIENLERCDSSTREFLKYYLRNKDQRVGLIMSVRSEGKDRIKDIMEEVKNGGGEIIKLGKIGYREAKKIMREIRYMKEVDMKELYRRSEGNPQFLKELVSIYDERWRYDRFLPIPKNIREAVEERIKRLNDIKYNLMRVSSVIGSDVDLNVLKILYPYWEEIKNMGEFFKGNKFRSEIYREVSYSLLPDNVKVKLHKTLGKYYEERDKFKSCYHYYLSGDRRGARICYDCGIILNRRYSIEDSIRYLEYSHYLMKKYRVKGKIKKEICRNLGDAYAIQGRYEDSLRVYSESRGLAVERARIYYRMGDHKKAMKILRNGLRYAKGIEKGRIYGELGVLYYGKSKYELAEKYGKNYLWIAIKERSYIDIARAYRRLGNIYMARGDLDIALKYYEMVYNIANDHGYLIEVEIALNNMSGVYFEKYNLERALRLMEESKEIAQKIGDIEGLPLILMNIGVVYGEMGNPRKEIKIYHCVKDMFKKLGDKERYARVLGNIGNSLSDMGKFNEAGEYLKKALAIEEDIKNYGDIIWMSVSLGEITLMQGDMQSGKRILKKSYELVRITNNRLALPFVLKDIGIVKMLLDEEDAGSLFNESAEKYWERENYIRSVESQCYLLFYYILKRNIEEAMEKLKELIKVKEDKKIKDENIPALLLAKNLIYEKKGEIRRILNDVKKKSKYDYLLYLLIVSEIMDDFKPLAVKEFREIGSKWADMLEVER